MVHTSFLPTSKMQKRIYRIAAGKQENTYAGNNCNHPIDLVAVGFRRVARQRTRKTPLGERQSYSRPVSDRCDPAACANLIVKKHH
jgi:hypothetical protein